MIGYKAFDKNMKCKGFQFEVGKTYSISEEEIVMCEKGFHFCLNPLDCLNYYDLTDSVFCEVESTGKEIAHTDDSKICTNIIKINKKLDLKEFIKLSENWLFKNEESSSGNGSKLASSGNGSKLASSGNGSKLASSGYRSQLASSGYGSQLASSGYGSKLASSGNGSKLASSGYGSQLASSGDGSQLASSGDGSQLASSGYGSQLASSGYGSQLASSGYRSQLASSGYRSQLASSGYGSQLASSGYGSKLASSGKNSIVAAIGKNSMAMGLIGCWIVLAEYYDEGVVKCIKAAKIDGTIIEENTYYKLENENFVKCE